MPCPTCDWAHEFPTIKTSGNDDPAPRRSLRDPIHCIIVQPATDDDTAAHERDLGAAGIDADLDGLSADPPDAGNLISTAADTLTRIAFTRVVTALPRTASFMLRSFTRGDRSADAGNPPIPVTPSLGAHVAIDEALLALARGPNRFPTTERFERVGAEVRDAYDLFDREGWLAEPASYHLSPPELRNPAIERAIRPQMHFERILFHSDYAPHHGEPGRERWLGYEHNHTAYAWMFRHRDRPRPWIVCLHGFGTGMPVLDVPAFRAQELHERFGLNVVLPVLPLHGPRKVGRMSGEALMDLDIMNTVHGVTQAIWDVRRLLGWIRTQEPTAVGVFGLSLGAHVTAMLASVEPDLDLALAGIPVCNLTEMFMRHSPRSVKERAKSHQVFGRRTNALTRVISPLALEPRVPPEARCLFAGLGDRMTGPRQAFLLWQHWGEPEISWYKGNHMAYRFSGQVRDFIESVLEARGFRDEPLA